MAKLELAGRIHDVARIEGGGIRMDNAVVPADFCAAGDGSAVVTVAGRRARVRVVRSKDQVWVHAGGRAWLVKRVEAAGAVARDGAASDEMRAAMPGTVVAVEAQRGAIVAAGDTILVVESMKLETSIVTPRDGVVAEIAFPPGATFDKGAVLARLAPKDETG